MQARSWLLDVWFYYVFMVSFVCTKMYSRVAMRNGTRSNYRYSIIQSLVVVEWMLEINRNRTGGCVPIILLILACFSFTISFLYWIATMFDVWPPTPTHHLCLARAPSATSATSAICKMVLNWKYFRFSPSARLATRLSLLIWSFSCYQWRLIIIRVHCIHVRQQLFTTIVSQY